MLDTDYIHIDPDDRFAHAFECHVRCRDLRDLGRAAPWCSARRGAPRDGAGRDGLRALPAPARIDVLFTTTALFNRLIDADPHAFSSLRVLLTGGEAGDPQRMRKALEHPPASPLHVYGPTETTTFATSYPLRDLSPDAATAPIGWPIANTTAYVLDAGLEPVPAGVSG